jgi:uncharacterized protein with PQ loop repeat
VKDKLIDSIPLFASILIEYGNAGQLWKMWRYHTAAGQNLYSYISVLAAIILWLLYYRFRLGKTVAYYVTWIAVFMISAIIVTIICLQGGIN